MRFISRLRERLRDERGMTMIELMVASVICAVGIVATVGVMDRSRDLGLKNEYREAMVHQGQRELEKLMELPWANFSHGAAAPTASPYAGTPSGGNFAYDRNNTGTTETLVTSVNGQVPSSFSTWTDSASRLSGRVYRYVTRIDSNSRRLTIVVTATGAGANSAKPILLSTIKTKPIT